MDKNLRLTDRLVDISFCGLSASLYRAHTVQLTAIMEDMEDFSRTLFYRRFFQTKQTLVSSLFSNFALVKRLRRNVGSKKSKASKPLFMTSLVKTKHSLLFRVQPKASETYWMEIT